MAKFTVFAKVHGTIAKEVEADTANQARATFEAEWGETPISLCHQCLGELCDNPVIGDVVEVINDA